MLAERLRKVLSPEALVSPKSDGSVTLREADVMDVTVARVPSGVTTINLQKMGDLSGVDDGPWKQRCDYMFAVDTGDDSEVLFIELKRSLDSERKEKAMEQLRRSPPILMYLQSLCELEREHLNQPEGERRELPLYRRLHELRWRYLVISERYTGRLDKQPVRAGGGPSMEEFRTIQVGVVVGLHLSFERLFRS